MSTIGDSRLPRPGADTDTVSHGTIKGYRTQGCHCDACRAAHAAGNADWKARRLAGVPNVPARAVHPAPELVASWRTALDRVGIEGASALADRLVADPSRPVPRLLRAMLEAA